jgi:hypothetical protein
MAGLFGDSALFACKIMIINNLLVEAAGVELFHRVSNL